MFCKNCGKNLSDEAKFCNNCGTQVTATLQSQPLTQAPPMQAAQTPPMQAAQAPPMQVAQTPPMQAAQAPSMQLAQTPPMQAAQAPPMQAAQAPPMQVAQTPPMQVAQIPPMQAAQAPPMQAAQAPSYMQSYAPQKRGKAPVKILISVIAVLLVVAVGFGFLSNILIGGNYPFKKGSTVEQNVKADKKSKLGSLKKTGWQLDIPQDAFSQDGKLSMKVLSESESQSYQDDDFTFYGTPVELTFDEEEHSILGAPVSITMQIPKSLMKDLAAEELFFATYYDGQWEYILPDSIDLKKGTATLEIYHFSFWGFGKPSEEKQIQTYAQNMAALKWERDNQSKQLRDALSRQYDDLFESMNIENESIRGQLVADVISALEEGLYETGGVAPLDALAQMANSASSGDKSAFQNKLLEFTGKAICHVMEKDVEKFASYANVLGGLGSVAGAMAEGDTDGALHGVADILKGLHPMVALADSAMNLIKNQMENAIDVWSQNELEKAYQVYIGEAAGKWGASSGFEGDIDNIFITMGGGERAFNIKIVKKYCEKYGIKEKNLSQSEREKIISDAKAALKRKFDERKVSESGIAEIKVKEESFIAALKAEGLLSHYYYAKFFGQKKGDKFNVGDRLARLYSLRSLVLGYVDEDKIAELTDKEIAIIIRQWIYYSEQKDRASFFKYLRDSGYVVEPLKKDPTFAWVLTGVDELPSKAKNTSYSYTFSKGKATYKVYSDSSGDVFESSMAWTEPNSRYKSGETVKLTISASIDNYQWHGKNDGYLHIGLNYMSASISARLDVPGIEHGYATGGAVRLIDKDEKDYAIVDTDYGKIKTGKISRDVSASFPEGSEYKKSITLYVATTTGTARYNYAWTQID